MKQFYTKGNIAQKRAITHADGPCLILAGPGSGKTFVIVERIRFLIEQAQIPQEQILTVTFTRAAAREMRLRFLRETGNAYRKVHFSTFHAFFYHALNREVLNYDDMAPALETRLQEDPALLSALRARFRYFLVDEFQDISPDQYRILRLLAGEENHIFAVGDDDQSIYAFRGADPDVMKRFAKTTPGISVLRLNVNYRCRKNIIGVSEALIRKNKNRFKKRAHAGRTDAKGELSLKLYPDMETEVRDVLLQYRKVRAEGVSAAIIVRTNEERERFVRQMRRHQIENEHCVMTMHHAKGLEFDTVFLPRLNEGILPVHRSKETGRLEEERRLFYVGITRARSCVYLSCTFNNTRDGAMSRFLREIIPYLRKHGTYAIFKSTFLTNSYAGSEQTIEGIGAYVRGTLSARLS